MDVVQSTETIYKTLESEIIQFHIEPGEVLSENTLCERFAVSRTPIRSVLQRLQEKELVQIIPKKGTIVTLLNYDIVNQSIYERVAIETMVLRDFINNCSPADVEIVRHALSEILRIGNLYTTGNDAFNSQEFLAADYKMHESWYSATNKMFLWSQIGKIQASYSRFCSLDVLKGNNVPDVIKEHIQMMKMIDTRETENIEALFKRHLYGGIRRLGDRIFSEFSHYFSPASLHNTAPH